MASRTSKTSPSSTRSPTATCRDTTFPGMEDDMVPERFLLLPRPVERLAISLGTPPSTSIENSRPSTYHPSITVSLDVDLKLLAVYRDFSLLTHQLTSGCSVACVRGTGYVGRLALVCDRGTTDRPLPSAPKAPAPRLPRLPESQQPWPQRAT